LESFEKSEETGPMNWNAQPVTTCHQGESRTENHWHSRSETYPLCFQDNDAWVTN